MEQPGQGQVDDEGDPGRDRTGPHLRRAPPGAADGEPDQRADDGEPRQRPFARRRGPADDGQERQRGPRPGPDARARPHGAWSSSTRPATTSHTWSATAATAWLTPPST